MSTNSPEDIGLGGDGDEIDAVEEVERAFGVTLDFADAPNWRTAGDVYAALLKVLPDDEASRPDVWQRFATALTSVTGVDPKRIGPESVLIPKPTWKNVATANAIFWLIIVASVIAGIATAD